MNPIYLRIRDITGQFKKNKNDNVWYLIISGDADILKKIANILKIIRASIEENTDDIVQYDKNYMKIKLESNNILPTDSIINMHQVTIIIRLVFQRYKKLYPHIYLDDCLHKS